MAYAEFIERGYGREDTGDWTAGMTAPPPGGWQPYQPGQSPPPYGTAPGNFPPTGPPPGYPQGQWPQQPQPPKGGNTTKWLLVAVAVLLVIGVTIGATLLFTRGTGDATTNPSSTQNASDFASAGDVGPVTIITEEPTCNNYIGINNAIAGVQANGWGESRDRLGAASQWTADQRRQVEAVITVIRNSADQAVELSKITPHRVVRELYSQFAAYGRAYAASIAEYKPSDNQLATVNVAAGNSLMAICNSIRYGSINRSLAVPPAPAPTHSSPAGDLNAPAQFITSPNSVCAEWLAVDSRFQADTAAWQAMDTSLTATEWTPEQRAIQLGVLPRLLQLADEVRNLGIKSGNATWEDFAITASLYLQAYAASGDAYVMEDSYLTTTAFRLRNTVSAACESATG